MAAIATKAKGPTLPQKLSDEALRLKVEIAGQSEDQIRHKVREAWIEENRAAIEGINAWVAKHGLPLAKYRAFDV